MRLNDPHAVRGCGTGELGEPLARDPSAEVVAIDLPERNVARW